MLFCLNSFSKAMAIGYFNNSTTIARLHNFILPVDFFTGNKSNPFNYTDIALDTAGNIFIADYNGNAIRKLEISTGEYTVIADNTKGVLGPSAIAINHNGDIYFIEKNSHKIKKIDFKTSVISTYFESFGTYSGHNLKFDKSGNLHFVFNGMVYKIDKTTKGLFHIAGNPGTANIGDGGLATNAKLGALGIAFDSSGNLYIADDLNKRIRVVNSSTGMIYTYAGGQAITYPFPYKDSIPAKNLKLIEPRGMCFDQNNNLLFNDEGTGLLYKINRADSMVYFAKEFNQGVLTDLSPYPYIPNYPGLPQGVACDLKTGNVYVAEMGQYNLKKLSMFPENVPPPVTSYGVASCQFSKEDTLTATGVNLKWYATSVGGTALAKSPLIKKDKTDTTLYFVSQTIGGQESDRTGLIVMVYPTPNQPKLLSKKNYCLGDSDAQVQIETYTDPFISLYWFKDSLLTKSVPYPVINPNIKGQNEFYVVGYDQYYQCTGSPLKVSVNVLHPDLPIFTSPINLCFGKKADLLVAQGTNIRWYTNLSSDTGSITAPILQTNAFQDRTFYITQTDSFGCISDTGIINVYVHPTPPKPFVQNQFQYCINQKAEALNGVGVDLKWYTNDSSIVSKTAPTPDTRNQGNQFYYATQTNTLGCESEKAIIEIKVHPKPVINIEEKISKPYTGLPIELNCSSDIGKTYNWNTGDNGTKVIFTPKNEGRYYFWVQSTSEFGCKSDTSWHYVDILPSEYWNSDFEVHPNPFKNNIRLTNVNLQDIMSVNLYNLYGRRVFQSELPLKSLELYIPDNLTSGYYLLEINTVGHAHPTRLLFKE